MAPGIPSKCDKCGEVCPSKQALLAHKAEMHPGDKIKSSAVKKVRGAEGINSPKTPGAGSPKVMNQWMSGKTRSNEIAKAIARSRQGANEPGAARRDTPAPVSVSITSSSLDESINLLHDSRNDPASPYLTTMRVFPSTMVATPSGDSAGTWRAQPRQVPEPEPEKSKRGRERYEDETGESGTKKSDDKVTPEGKKAPRSLDNELAELHTETGPETQDAMEIEFSSVEIDTEEWNLVSVQVQQDPAPTPTPTPPSTLASDPSQGSQGGLSSQEMASQETLATGYIRHSQILSNTMRDWLHSDDFSGIPQEQEQSPGLAPLQYDSLDLQESQFERLERGQAMIRELKEKLEVSESTRQDQWETMTQLENRISDIELENRQLRQGKDQAEDAVASLTRDLTMKDTELHKRKQFKDNAVQMANKAGQRIKTLEAEANEAKSLRAKMKGEYEKMKGSLDTVKKSHNDRILRVEQEKRAEVERLKAINIQATNDLKRLRVTGDVVTELKASLVKTEGEREMEKLKADKAQEMANKLEDLLKEAQVEKANYEKRNTELLNSNRVLSRSQPCNRENCDHGCGRDHHCGTVSRRNRSRNRRRSSNSEAPTVANLADAAGSSVNSMQQVVDGVRNNQQQQLQQARLPPRGPRSQSLHKPKKDWKTGICWDFFNLRMCARGESCRNAHELIGADVMAAMNQEAVARPRTGSLGTAPSQAAAAAAAPRTRVGFRPIPNPVFHPDHPLAKQLGQANQVQMSGNARGQRTGVATVQTPQPQVPSSPGPQVSQGASTQGPFLQPQPQIPAQAAVTQQPRTYREAALDRAARQTVRDSMQQQASTGAQINALEEDPWMAQMEEAFGMRMSALLGPRSQSQDENPSPTPEEPGQQ